jgi:hypothetical protein
MLLGWEIRYLICPRRPILAVTRSSIYIGIEARLS